MSNRTRAPNIQTHIDVIFASTMKLNASVRTKCDHINTSTRHCYETRSDTTCHKRSPYSTMKILYAILHGGFNRHQIDDHKL